MRELTVMNTVNGQEYTSHRKSHTDSGNAYPERAAGKRTDIRSFSGKKNRRARRRLHRASAVITAFLLGFVIAVCMIAWFGVPSFAKEHSADIDKSRYYKSITITEGDTLWGIARQYMPKDVRSIDEYVQELKSMNNLSSDRIVSGDKLVVSYQNSESVQVASK